MISSTVRMLTLLGFMVCCVLLAAAFYLQYGFGYEPCLLCLLQRWIMILLGVVLLLALLHRPRHWGMRVYGLLVLLIGTLGASVAARQVWLQMQPPSDSGLCMPSSWSYLINNFPLMQAFKMLVAGSQECGQVQWMFWGLSMAGWSMVFFVLFAALGLFVARMQR